MSALIYFITIILSIELGARAFAEDIRDIKPPMELPFDWTFIWIFLIVALLVAGYFILRKLKKQKKEVVAPQIIKTPFEIAMELLEKLSLKALPQRGFIKQYYIELGDIVRHYIEGQFAYKAPEMTTYEFMEAIRASNRLSGTHKNLLKEFLNSCDMVKFAKYAPNDKEIESSFALAKQFINESGKTENTTENKNDVV